MLLFRTALNAHGLSLREEKAFIDSTAALGLVGEEVVGEEWDCRALCLFRRGTLITARAVVKRGNSESRFSF